MVKIKGRLARGESWQPALGTVLASTTGESDCGGFGWMNLGKTVGRFAIFLFYLKAVFKKSISLKFDIFGQWVPIEKLRGKK